MRIVRYIVGAFGFLLVWFVVAVVFGIGMSILFPPAGRDFMPGIGLDWRNLPGTTLGLFGGVQSFRASVRGPKEKDDKPPGRGDRVRPVFILIASFALPGLLWQSFEMYGLTIRGSQMLFFSIAHTSPVLVLAVMAAVPLLPVLLGMAAVGALRPSFRVRLGMSARALSILAAFLVFHFVLLVAYELWATIDWLRVPLCIAGLVFLTSALVATLAALGSEASRVPAR